jgi:hypothetical protein
LQLLQDPRQGSRMPRSRYRNPYLQDCLNHYAVSHIVRESRTIRFSACTFVGPDINTMGHPQLRITAKLHIEGGDLFIEIAL